MGEIVYLRDMNDADLPLVMAWRSNHLIYQGFYTQKTPLQWQEHFTWWKSRPSSWKQFIIVLVQENHSRDIGVVTVGQLEHWSPEIGYFIGDYESWGHGYGKWAVQLALDWLINQGKEYCHTTVLVDNQRSIRLLKSLGFEVGMPAREGEVYYRRKL